MGRTYPVAMAGEGDGAMTRGLVAILVVALAALLSACGSSGDDITGFFMLIDEDGDIEGDWDNCSGTGGYDDLNEGTFANLENESGDRIGGTSLRNINGDDLDTLVAANTATSILGSDISDEEVKSAPEEFEGVSCIWIFEFEDVPESEIYVVEVGTRGEGTYTRAQLVEEDFFIAIGIS
jgi:hypothetical protein